MNYCKMFPIGIFRRPQPQAEIKKEDENEEIYSGEEPLTSSEWSELSSCETPQESDSDGFEVIKNKHKFAKNALEVEPHVNNEADDVTDTTNESDVAQDVVKDVKTDVGDKDTSDVTNDVADVSCKDADVTNLSDDITSETVPCDCIKLSKVEEKDNETQKSGDEKIKDLFDSKLKMDQNNCTAMIVWKKAARKGLQLSLTKLLILGVQLFVIIFSLTYTCAHEMPGQSGHEVHLRSCDQDLLQSHDSLKSCDQVLDLPASHTGKYSSLNEIGVPELSRQSVHVKDPKYVASVITDLIQAGDNKLQVVADFDFTLSCFIKNGEKCVSCHKALDDSPLLPDDYRNQAHALRDHYYPLEIDPHLTKEEKFPLMEEWWNKSHQLLIDYKLSRHDIEEIVQNSKLFLRQGCTDTFELLHKHGIPLMIFSAGLGDIIKEAIAHQATMYDNMKIVGNFMAFDNKGIITGFQGKNIHSLNKNESALSHADGYFQKLSHRDGLILLGDNLGDLHMADGAEHIKTKLTIGFLNDKIDERLESYKNSYDIVIVGDETLDIPNAILKAIFK